MLLVRCPTTIPTNSFYKTRLYIEQDEIKLDYIYFKESENILTGIDTSLPYAKREGQLSVNCTGVAE